MGGTVLEGIRTTLSSPYLLGIVAYMLLYTVTSTFLYFQQAEIVQANFHDRAARTQFFAHIDLAVNSLTALTQLFLTGRIVRRIGIAMALAVLPLITVLGFGAVGLAAAPLTICQIAGARSPITPTSSQRAPSASTLRATFAAPPGARRRRGGSPRGAARDHPSPGNRGGAVGGRGAGDRRSREAPRRRRTRARRR